MAGSRYGSYRRRWLDEEKEREMRFVILLVGLACLSLNCTDATMASFAAYGAEHHVRMYNGGILVAEWYSTGKVTSISKSDGWQFKDKATGKLVRVGGDVIIEVVD
jgi:hypothetical protein